MCIHLQSNTIYIHISSIEIVNIDQLYVISEFKYNFISNINAYIGILYNPAINHDLSFLELMVHIIYSFTSSATTLDTVCTLVMRVGG